MKYGLLDVARSYLGNVRSSRWYLGSTMIFDQEISFDRDYDLLAVNVIGNIYGYVAAMGGDLIPDDLQGTTLLGIYCDSTASTAHVQVEAEIPGLESITMYAASSGGTNTTVELFRQPGLLEYTASSPAMMTVFVAGFLDGQYMDVNLTGTIV